MPPIGEAKRICIYVNEDARVHGTPVYLAVLELLRSKGAAGAIVTRGIAGFDSHSPIHSGSVMALSVGMPVKIEWVEIAARVEEMLPALKSLVHDGLITMEDVTVVKRSVAVKGDVLSRTVASLMTADVVSAHPATPLCEAVSLLLNKGLRSLPVVDEGRRVVGIVTDGDLLRNTSLPIRLGLQPSLTQEQVQNDFAELRSSGRTVGEIMSMPVVTISAKASLRQAGAVMVENDLKRLPVVDVQGCLAGVISRVDILRAMSALDGPVHGEAPAGMGTTIDSLMNREAPRVLPGADLEEIVQALEAGRQQRVVVVDENDRVVGLITDGDLLRRSMYARHPSLVRRLRGVLTGVQPVAFDLPGGEETAGELMTEPVITIGVDESLSDALGLMLMHELKRLPVVDGDGKLVGVLGRSSVLRGLMEGEPA